MPMKFEKEEFLPIYIDVVDGERIKEVDSDGFVITITPAIVKTAQGNKTIFPGNREKLIEKAIRSLIKSKTHVEKEDDESIHIEFTLKWLKEQLDKNQSNMTFEEIKEGLNVMRSCDIEVIRKNTKAKFEQTFCGPILDIRFQVVTKEDEKEDEDILYSAYLHPTIVELIKAIR